MTFLQELRARYATAFFIIVVSLVMGLSVGQLAHGEGYMDYGLPMDQSGSMKSSTPSSISSFRRGNLRIPRSSKCEMVLMETQTRMGRELTHAEIEANLDAILSQTGETLEALPAPPTPPAPRRVPDPGWNCFTGEMRVATPSGPRRIDELNAGDEVVSLDVNTGKMVVNRVRQKRATPNRMFGRLRDLSTPIDVTPRHRFYSEVDGVRDYRAVGDLNSTDLIFDENLRPMARGCYVGQGEGTVHELEMVGEPRNYLVEGVLVHNVKF